MSNALTVSVIGLAYVSLFLLERARPLRQPKAHLLHRVLVNMVISATAFAAAAALVKPAATAMLEFSAGKSFGLIPFLGLTGPFEIVAVFPLLDLSF